MVTLAQALVIAWINEQIPVTTERNDVVYGCCQRPVSGITGGELPGTLTAEWFAQQLLNPELVLPDREQVPAVIRCAAPPAVLGPVLIAPALSGQRGTSRMPTRSQCLTCHVLSPPRQAKQKKPRPTTQRTSASYHRPRLSKHLPSAILTRNSLLQSRQNKSRFSALSSWVILLTRRFRLQIGQTSHPSCTVNILPRNPFDCNAFTPLCH